MQWLFAVKIFWALKTFPVLIKLISRDARMLLGQRGESLENGLALPLLLLPFPVAFGESGRTLAVQECPLVKILTFENSEAQVPITASNVVMAISIVVDLRRRQGSLDSQGPANLARMLQSH